MRKEEAMQILGVNDIEEVEFAFDDLVFEYKSFFVTKVPFTKLFSSKLKKLNRIFKAKEILLSEIMKVDEVTLQTKKENKRINNVLEAYRLFGENETKIKLSISQSENYKEISFYVDVLIANYKSNAVNWKKGALNHEGNVNVKMSVEHDVMKIYDEIKRFNSLGYSTFEEINNLSDDNLLKQEAIRLSLWFKFEENV